MTKICIIQPSYIPWKGYFHQIAKSDIFVFLDTVQYDKRGWRNRNQIKTPKGPTWLTIPVQAHGSHDGLLIKDVQIQLAGWADVHTQKIRLNYMKSFHFTAEFPWISEMLFSLDQRYTNISSIAAKTTQLIARRMGIQHTQFVYASDLPIKRRDPNAYLIELIQALGGTSYLSGPSAQNYLDPKLFEDAGITLEWMDYDYPAYPQLHPPFTHHVSILDLILMVGLDAAPDFIWKQGVKSNVS